MRKGWIVAGVLLLGAVAAAPLVVGQGVEGVVRGGMDALVGPQSVLAQNGLQDFMKVSEVQYQKGAFSSSQSMKLSLGCTTDGQKPVDVVVKSTIQHGPFPGFAGLGLATVDTEVVLPPEVQGQLDKAFAGKKWTIRTVVGFDRSSTSTLTLPAGSVDEATAKLEWNEARGEVRASADGKTTRYTLSFPRAVITPKGEPGGMTLEDLRVEGSSSPAGANKYFLNSDQKGSLSRMTFEAEGQKVALEDVNLEAATGVSGDSGTLKYVLGAKKADVAGQALSDVSLDLGLEKVRTSSYEQMMEAMRGLSGNVCQPQATDPNALAFKLLPPLLEMVQAGPVIKLERLAFRLPEGETVLSGQAEFVDPSKVNLTVNPQSALEQLRASLKFSGSEAALTKLGLGEGLSSMAQGGMVKKSGDKLESDLKFENQKLTVNGTEIPLGL